MGEFIEVARIQELESGKMKMVTARGHEILLVRTQDKCYAVSNRCPHMNGDLSQGKLEGTIITCPVHGSQFDISTGQVVRWLKGGLMSKVSATFKPGRSLKTYNVRIENGRILIEL